MNFNLPHHHKKLNVVLIPETEILTDVISFCLNLPFAILENKRNKFIANEYDLLGTKVVFQKRNFFDLDNFGRIHFRKLQISLLRQWTYENRIVIRAELENDFLQFSTLYELSFPDSVKFIEEMIQHFLSLNVLTKVMTKIMLENKEQFGDLDYLFIEKSVEDVDDFCIELKDIYLKYKFTNKLVNISKIRNKVDDIIHIENRDKINFLLAIIG